MSFSSPPLRGTPGDGRLEKSSGREGWHCWNRGLAAGARRLSHLQALGKGTGGTSLPGVKG